MAGLGRLVAGDHRAPHEELVDLFSSEAEAETWARGVADAAGIAPSAELRVIAALRKAEPRLSLKPATYLAGRLA